MDTAPLPNPIVPGVYRIRCGDLVEVTHIDPSLPPYVVKGTDKDVGPCAWTADGRFLNGIGPNPLDLVAFVEPERPTASEVLASEPSDRTVRLPNPIVPGTYRTRNGEEATVTGVNPNTELEYPVCGHFRGHPENWNLAGAYQSDAPSPGDFDLVALVSATVGDTHGESPSVPDGPTAEPARPLVLLTASDFVAMFSDIQARAHSINRANGWWDDRDQYLQSGLPNAHAHTVCSLIGLAHTEFSEAVEAARKHPQSAWSDATTKDTMVRELAGVVVRTMDIAHAFGLPLADAILAELEHNANRGHRHGGKAA